MFHLILWTDAGIHKYHILYGFGFYFGFTSWAGQLFWLLIISHIFHKKWFKPPILLYFFFLRIKFVILIIWTNSLHLLCPHWALDGTRFSSFPCPVVHGNNYSVNSGYYWFLLCLPIKEQNPSLQHGTNQPQPSLQLSGYKYIELEFALWCHCMHVVMSQSLYDW